MREREHMTETDEALLKKEGKWCRLLWEFLRQYRFEGMLFLLSAAVYMGVFFLYDLEMEAVLYAAVLCLIALTAVLAVRFFFYVKRHEERLRILKIIELEFEWLPESRNLLERDYQDMLRRLGQLYNTELTERKTERQETLNYYTAWVHQIKTPIAVMRMQLQGKDTEENRALLAELFRIEQYVEMVLCYMRLDGDSSDLRIEQYDLDHIIRQAVHKYAGQFVQKRLRLIYEPVRISVLTDEKWLLFLIEQILSNAVKYTNSGAITITVSEDKVLRIEDTGIGIAAEDIPRIFEKGFTGYNGRADKKSTGLGLYLCKKAADKISASVSVESVQGKGSVFYVDLSTTELEVE